MRNKLTNQPISKEMDKVLTKLKNGEWVGIEEIENTKEIKLARSCVSDTKQTSLLANREDLQENILNKLEEIGSVVIDDKGEKSYNGYIECKSRLDIVIGLPASGKSSAIVDTISEEMHARIIDNDEAKKMIPEYNNGWGASTVHDESKFISKAQLSKSLMNHENIVLPKVGSDFKKLNNIIESAKRFGYEVNIHYVDLSRDKALGRMLNRFLEEGRFLDPKLIDKYCNETEGNKIERVYEELKKGGILDGYSKWNNDVKRGERPKFIEASCSGRFIEQARSTRDFSVNLRTDRSGRGSREQSNREHVEVSGRVEKSKQQGNFDENKKDLHGILSGTRTEEIKKDIRKSGFQITKSLENNILDLSNMAGKHITLKEISQMYKEKKIPEDQEILVNKIANECKYQELQRTSFEICK